MRLFELCYENIIYSSEPISLEALKPNQGYTSMNNHRYKCEVEGSTGKFRKKRTFIDSNKGRAPLVSVEIRDGSDVFLSARTRMIFSLMLILFSLIVIGFSLTIINRFVEFVPIGIVVVCLNFVSFHACRISFEMDIREFEKDFMHEFNICYVPKKGTFRVYILDRVLYESK